MNATNVGKNLLNSLSGLARVYMKPIAWNALSIAHEGDGADLRHNKVQAWRHRVLLKKALRLHRRMGRGAENHSLAVLDERGFVIAWYDRARSTCDDDVLARHVSQFYLSTDVATGMPARHLKSALRNGRTMRNGWRLHHDGVMFWGTTTITPILLRDGRLQGFVHLTRAPRGLPLTCVARVNNPSTGREESCVDMGSLRQIIGPTQGRAPPTANRWMQQMRATA